MRIVRHPSFEKKTKRLPQNVRTALADRLELFLTNPRHPLLNNHPLSGRRRGTWSINITGDWRLIYAPVETDAILLLEIGTHHDLYGT